jgi:hypothetical protein
MLFNLPVHLFKKGDEFLLTFAFITVAADTARLRIKGRKEMEHPNALALVFMPIG